MTISQRIAIGLFAPALLCAQALEPRQILIDFLDGLARTQLDSRKQAIAKIETQADAERRRASVREKIARLIGGLPKSGGPVAVKEFGSNSGDGFRVDKLAFESLPGFWVTANLYVPLGREGPFPAIVLSPGHEPAGKQSQYGFGVNFARMGIISLAYDPIGQGERLQYFDTDRKASHVGAPTGEHGEANLPALLIGDDLLRYIVNDGVRAIDYLTSRKDVDGLHIGALGCSGGGTATAALAALDDRVKVAGTACYITSFQELLPSPTGVQEAEQSIPHFIEEGLDLADWVEAAAPRPYAIISTTGDMFPFEGAKQSYEEAKRIYALYGAADRLQWITGPGGHGNLGPISSAILGFFAKFLRGDTAEHKMETVRPTSPNDLLCTPTGQVATSLGGETVASLNRARAQVLIPAQRTMKAARLREAVRNLAGIATPTAPKTGDSIPMAVEHREGYRVETTSIRSATGADLRAVLAIPDGAGRKQAMLWMESGAAAIHDEVERLVKSGRIVMMLEAQPWPQGTESIKSPYLGSFNLLSLRAFLVGKTLVGIRTADALLAIDRLRARPEVDARLTVYGNGPLGMVALNAAVLDPRIRQVIVENTLSSYRSIVDLPLHRNVSEVVIPGVLLQYDVADLLAALSPREVRVINPVDGAGAPAVLEKLPKNVTVHSRHPGEPLPID